MCIYKYINTTFWVYFYCLCLYSFRTDHPVLDNQLEVHPWERLILPPEDKVILSGGGNLLEKDNPHKGSSFFIFFNKNKHDNILCALWPGSVFQCCSPQHYTKKRQGILYSNPGALDFILGLPLALDKQFWELFIYFWYWLMFNVETWLLTFCSLTPC